jgi:hypothetical protein
VEEEIVEVEAKGRDDDGVGEDGEWDSDAFYRVSASGLGWRWCCKLGDEGTGGGGGKRKKKQRRKTTGGQRELTNQFSSSRKNLSKKKVQEKNIISAGSSVVACIVIPVCGGLG